MIDQDSDFTGELGEEVLQEDPPYKAGVCVPVVVEGPVTVQNVGSRAAGSSNQQVLLASVEGTRIAGADPRRRIARVIATQNFFIAPDQSSVVAGVAALWPLNVPCEITHTEEIWVRVATADAVVSLMSENWAD